MLSNWDSGVTLNKISKNDPKYIQVIKKNKNDSMLHFEALKSIQKNTSNYEGGNWFSCKKPNNFFDPTPYLQLK